MAQDQAELEKYLNEDEIKFQRAANQIIWSERKSKPESEFSYFSRRQRRAASRYYNDKFNFNLPLPLRPPSFAWDAPIYIPKLDKPAITVIMHSTE